MPPASAAARKPRASAAGTGDTAKQTAETEHLAAGPYRMQLVNTLLGAAQVEALLCEQLGAGGDTRRAAHRQQLLTGGVMDPARKRRTRPPAGGVPALADAARPWAAARDRPGPRRRSDPPDLFNFAARDSYPSRALRLRSG